MKTTHLSLIVAMAFGPIVALADDSIKSPQANPTVHPGGPGVPPEIPQTDNVKFDTTILAVDPIGKLITIDDKNTGPRNIQVFGSTKRATGGEAVDWSELKIGTRVKGAYRRDGDKFVAESLSIVR